MKKFLNLVNLLIGIIFGTLLTKYGFSQNLVSEVFSNSHVQKTLIHPNDIFWDNKIGSAGIKSGVRTIATKGTEIYIGGVDFGILKWNGNSWVSLGSGINGTVYSIFILNNILYAGGDFSEAGGILSNNIAKWDGIQWSSMGKGVNGIVYSITGKDNNLFIGGRFTASGDSSLKYIAKWNGSRWIGVGEGVSNIVYAMAFQNNDLIVGGSFTYANTTYVNNIARWNGSQWIPFNGGVNGIVSAIYVDSNDIYIGGEFAEINSIPVNRIIKWDGTNWIQLGNGIIREGGSSVRAISGIKGKLYVGGNFSMAGSINASYIACWNGSIWLPLGSGLDGTVRSIAILNDTVIAGGYFNIAGGKISDFISAWKIPPSPEVPIPQLPINNSKGVSATPRLGWNNTLRASIYNLQVSADLADWTKPVLSMNDISTNLIDVTIELSNNKSYYWKVSAKNDGGTSAWSGVFNFTTGIFKPKSPVLINPPDNAKDISIPINLGWNASKEATSYNIQVSTDTSFSNLIKNLSGITDTIQSISGLLNNTAYYWRANSQNSAGNSIWTSFRKFTTSESAPLIPTLISPIDKSTSISTNVTLNWNTSQGAKSYQIQIANDSSFSSILINQNNILNTFFNLTGLSNETVYYWRISANNQGGSSSWSRTWSFTTIAVVPNSPILKSPVNGALDVSVNPIITWNLSSRAKTYTIQVASNFEFTQIVFDNSIPSTNSIQIPTLKNNTIYFWRVCATNSGGTSNWSDYWNFTTIESPPGTPNLASPKDRSSGINLSSTLFWNSVDKAKSYQLQISRISDFNPILLDTSNILGTWLILNELNTNSTYFWKVRAVNSGGYSPWSEIWSFTTLVSAPSKPSLLLPPNQSSGIQINPVLNWNQTSDGKFYNLQISTDLNFTHTILNQINISNPSFIPTGLLNNTKYYWRVSAGNEGGNSIWSDIWEFTTIPVYPEEIYLNSVLAYFLSQPNIINSNSLDYQIVGLPGNSQLPISILLKGNQGTDWKVFWDNGAQENYFIKNDGSSPFSFSTGRAFWILNKESIILDKTIHSAPLNSKMEVEIPLHQGWNLITNPFTNSILWDKIKKYNNFEQPIWSYKNKFEVSSLFDPFIGYYFDNRNNLSNLKIPYNVLFSNSSENISSNQFIWSINISLFTNSLLNNSVKIGVSNSAKDGDDDLDVRIPRSIFKGSDVGLCISENSSDYYAFDIRSSNDGVKVWDLEVNSQVTQNSILYFSELKSIPSHLEVYLLDCYDSKSINLKNDSTYHLGLDNSKYKFKIIIGTKKQVEDKILHELEPQTFKLFDNYPNPFNSSTNIKINIPIPSDIEISIYNILGKKIKILYNGIVNIGQHSYLWNGKDEKDNFLPSGIYLYKLFINQKNSIWSKMILLK